MSSANAKSHEPSMEEILASIRRIIADDQPLRPEAKDKAPMIGPVAPPIRVPRPPVVVSVDEEMVDLDNREPAPPVVADIATRDEADVEEPVVARRPEPPPIQEPPRPARREVVPPLAAEPLLSRRTDEAVGQAFQTLAGSVSTGSPRTLDDVVQDMLRPMLKAWLDDNLPGIVERLVRAEIERVARGDR